MNGIKLDSKGRLSHGNLAELRQSACTVQSQLQVCSDHHLNEQCSFHKLNIWRPQSTAHFLENNRSSCKGSVAFTRKQSGGTCTKDLDGNLLASDLRSIQVV